jgi:DNA-binding protein Fis
MRFVYLFIGRCKLVYNYLSENMGNNIELDLISVEKHLIQKVLQHTNGYKPEAARLLGIGLTTLYKKMEAYGL